MDELEALRAESRRDEAVIKVLDALIEAGLSGAMSWSRVHAAAEVLDMDEGEVIIRPGGRPADFGEFLMGVARALFTESQQHSLPVAFATGARPWECIPLGVHGRNCHGEDLGLLSDDELRYRREGAARVHQAFGSSPWLEGYRALVEDEVRGRAKRSVTAGEGEQAAAVDDWEQTEAAVAASPAACPEVGR
jgi:hypothetical protein